MQGFHTTLAAKANARASPALRDPSPNQNFTGAEVAIYTALNPWPRSQSGIGDFGTVFELADIVSTARDSNVSKADYGVGDGLHINWANGTAKVAILTAFKTFVQAMGYPTI